MGPSVKSSSALLTFTNQAEALWQAYLAEGAGQVDRAAYASLATCSPAARDEAPDAIAPAIQRIEQLSQQIACTPQGLNFVSGEAGLVPRRDLHAEFTQHLETLRRICGPQDIPPTP